MSRFRAIVLILIAVPIFFMMLMNPTAAYAAQPLPVTAAAPVAPPEVDGSMNVIDAETFQEVVDITERIAPYLYVGDDGLVKLRDVTAAELDVSEQFLADYREAMRHSNALIARGEIQVAPDMTVSVTEKFAPISKPVGPGIDMALGGADSSVMAAPGGDVPDWGAWNYGSGAMFYNSYPDWVYYRHQYYGLCNSLAAYLGLPWMSPSLVYFYGYNTYYFSVYCYNPYGTYFFIPFNYCYSGLGYKPAYFWVRMFGSYGYYWGWQGFWLRY